MLNYLFFQAHEFDECRFDVSVNDCLVWYLRARSTEEKQRWVDVLKSYKVIILKQQHMKYLSNITFSFLILHKHTYVYACVCNFYNIQSLFTY